jgi:tRNA G10  N-methylase Trm11
MNDQKIPTYIYNYLCGVEEVSLCALEMRAFFGEDSQSSSLESHVKIEPSRSPFIKNRIDVIFQGKELQDIFHQLKKTAEIDSTFKVIFVKNNDVAKSEEFEFKERRQLEREIGLHIKGKANLVNPEIFYGIMYVNGRWVFGEYFESEPVWFRHQQKPQNYSTALSTRVARAVANIAVPNPVGIKAIDPCCGIGTVLIEGLSMGINIVGSDVNPLATTGARKNLAYFGLNGQVALMDICQITDRYDVAIIDMPYNLCSVVSDEEKFEMLQSARSFTKKLVIVTIEPIDSILGEAGFVIVDRCVIKKGIFVRQVIVCE